MQEENLSRDDAEAVLELAASIVGDGAEAQPAKAANSTQRSGAPKAKPKPAAAKKAADAAPAEPPAPAGQSRPPKRKEPATKAAAGGKPKKSKPPAVPVFQADDTQLVCQQPAGADVKMLPDSQPELDHQELESQLSLSMLV